MGHPMSATECDDEAKEEEFGRRRSGIRHKNLFEKIPSVTQWWSKQEASRSA